MRLTDISLDWLLPGAVLLVGVMAAVAVVARGKRASDTSAADDSWERSEERRRRKEALYATASYVLLFCCAAVAAALSFHGLVGFGEQNLGLSDGWEYLVPFGLDGAAMFCSVLAVREASHGDAALGSRLLVWTFAGAAAWFNWVHAPRGINHAGAPHFFAGMSLSAAVLFDRALKQTRRAALREQGLVPRPLPQIRIVRWLRAPRRPSALVADAPRRRTHAGRGGRRGTRGPQGEGAEPSPQEGPGEAGPGPHQGPEPAEPGLGRLGRGGAPVEVAALTPATGSAQSVAEPAISEPGQLPLRPRPSLQAVNHSNSASVPELGASESAPVDLTVEDDTQALPRLDSLEQKLKDLEQQFG